VGAFGGPGAQDGDGAGGQRRDAVLAAFAVAADVGASPQVQVRAGGRGQLAGAQSGLDGQVKQGVVAASGPGGPVGGVKQGGGLDIGQEGDVGVALTSGWDRQDAGDVGGVFGMAQTRVAKQGVDRGQTGVAGAGAVAAPVLEVVEERGDQRRIQVGEVQLGRGSAGSVAGNASSCRALSQ
jgi:hypothetical protein